jgi:hypothetical protein
VRNEGKKDSACAPHGESDETSPFDVTYIDRIQRAEQKESIPPRFSVAGPDKSELETH